MRRFELAVPGSVDECLQILAKRGPDTKVVAGGTDLLPQLKNGVLKPGWVVDLSAVAELRAISEAPDGALRIGASVTARARELDARVRSRFPALAESAAMVGSVQVRNLATLGGNLCNAAPSADMAPPLLALDAEAVIAGPSGQRRVSMTSFFLGVAFLANGRLQRWEAVALLLLFLVQLPFPDTTVRYGLSGVYLALSILLLVRDRAFLRGHLHTAFFRSSDASPPGGAGA